MLLHSSRLFFTRSSSSSFISSSNLLRLKPIRYSFQTYSQVQSTMSTSQTPSQACCETPPIVSKGYEPKGKYITVDGLKTYTTGPSSASTAILVIYDIFGFFPQTIQGADILAFSDKDHQYQIFMPDFFDGKPADISWYPPDTKEKGEKLGNFFNTTAAPPATVERIPKIIKEIESKHSGIQKWGAVGYCWGGKIVNLTSQAGSTWKAAAACHPAMVDPKDAPGVTVPMLMIPSEGESKEDVEAYQKDLKVKHQITWFADQLHGFMAARADLEDPKVKAAYEKGYQTLLTFFHENL